jgi:hypothetical protein
MGATQLSLKELLPLDFVLKRLEKEFPFIFSLMVRWIQMIFGIKMYHEEMQMKFEYGCCLIIIGEVIVLGLSKNAHLLHQNWYRIYYHLVLH